MRSRTPPRRLRFPQLGNCPEGSHVWPFVARLADGERFVAWPEVVDRSRRLATALVAWGVQPGERIATLAFNDHRHIDAYFAVPCLGATLHPINVRWNIDEMASVLEHTRDRIIFVDAGLMDRATALADRCPWIEHLVRMGPFGSDGAPSPLRSGVTISDHDDLLGSHSPIADWPDHRPTPLRSLAGLAGESGVASAFFFRGDSEPFGPLGARAALWALRTWWQQGSRASTDRKNAAVPRAKRVAPAQSCHGGCESAKAKRNPDDSPFAAAHECARANNGNVETEIERQATHATHRINSVLSEDEGR